MYATMYAVCHLQEPSRIKRASSSSEFITPSRGYYTPFSPLETISTSLWASLHHRFPVLSAAPLFAFFRFFGLSSIDFSSVWCLFYVRNNHIFAFNKVQECSRCDSEFISYGLVCSVFSPSSVIRNLVIFFKCQLTVSVLIIFLQGFRSSFP